MMKLALSYRKNMDQFATNEDKVTKIIDLFLALRAVTMFILAGS